MSIELFKAYQPSQHEDDIYKRWEASGLFNPDVCIREGVAKADAEYFSIVLPPPNVTGTLHMGHAAMLAIEDVLIRYHRMKGERTLWVPGTDHAAVATESKVESLLIKEGYTKPKQELGREAFLERVRVFAQQSHDTIVNQCKKMGASLNWSREAYTLDEARSRAVRTVFKKMYDDGLIYRGYRVVNWSVKGQSTCSDDELVYMERSAKLYYFKYSHDFPITIATTRPETKLGDTAVAVNPNDERYQRYLGQVFTIDVGAAKPLSIKIIADSGIDPTFGTGALGVTPAHSPIDFEMYERQRKNGDPIGLMQVIGEDGLMTANAGTNYAGLTVAAARQKFVDYLMAQGLLEKEEDVVQNVGTSDRFKDVVEPLPKVQWFVNVNAQFKWNSPRLAGLESGQEVTLKQLMQTVVKNQQIQIIPDRFTKTYFHWIDNLRDWCISRQIWFGHQIPVWYKSSQISKNIPPQPIQNELQTLTRCQIEAPTESGWVQDTDTLDTWFSAGLWTFSTLGWPANLPATLAADLNSYHPTSVLETGYDILFFWVARMILMTTYTLGEIPFKTVYLHGLVRDEQGRKMSKTLDNIIDPLDMIAKFGTDATRLSLLIGSTPGNDVKLSEEKIAGFRNFTNKLWNIARFILWQINGDSLMAEGYKKIKNLPPPEPKTSADSWILDRLERVRREVTKNLDTFQLSYAGERLRDFTWNELADWYLEAAKLESNSRAGLSSEKRDDKSDILLFILQTILKLWHPFMPFVTEAIWQEVFGAEQLLMVAEWPAASPNSNITFCLDNGLETDEEKSFATVQKIIASIRNLRAANNVESAKKISIYVKGGRQMLENYRAILMGLARLEDIKVDVLPPPTAIGLVEDGLEVFVDLAGAVDLKKEKARLKKEIEEISKYVKSLEAKLANQDFVARAPESVVKAEQEKLVEAMDKVRRLQQQGGLGVN